MDEVRTGWGLAVLSAAGFGTLAIFGELAGARGMSIQTLLAFRFSLAVPLVWGFLAWQGRLRRLDGGNLAIAVALGALGYAGMSGLFLWGVARTTAGLGSILLYTYPVFVVALAVAFLDERLTWRRTVALVLALTGVVLVSGAQPRGVDPLGVVVLLLSAAIYAAYITVSGVVLEAVDAPTLSAHVIPAAGAAFVAVGAVTGTLALPRTPGEWAITGAVALFSTAIPIVSFYAAIRRIGASRTSIVSTVEPVFTVALGVLVLEERLTVLTLLGGAVVLTGVALVQAEPA
ncbi:MAG: DMT family transporter [Halanaeroarchaeum sp.]